MGLPLKQDCDETINKLFLLLRDILTKEHSGPGETKSPRKIPAVLDGQFKDVAIKKIAELINGQDLAKFVVTKNELISAITNKNAYKQARLSPPKRHAFPLRVQVPVLVSSVL